MQDDWCGHLLHTQGPRERGPGVSMAAIVKELPGSWNSTQWQGDAPAFDLSVPSEKQMYLSQEVLYDRNVFIVIHSFSSTHPHPIQNNRRTLTILGSVDRLKWLMCVAVTDSRQSTSNSTVVPQGICPRWRWNLSSCVQFPERELPAMQIKNCWSTDKEVLGKWPPDCNSASN